jgi:hypothetical protein
MSRRVSAVTTAPRCRSPRGSRRRGHGGERRPSSSELVEGPPPGRDAPTHQRGGHGVRLGGHGVEDRVPTPGASGHVQEAERVAGGGGVHHQARSRSRPARRSGGAAPISSSPGSAASRRESASSTVQVGPPFDDLPQAGSSDRSPVPCTAPPRPAPRAGAAVHGRCAASHRRAHRSTSPREWAGSVERRWVGVPAVGQGQRQVPAVVVLPTPPLPTTNVTRPLEPLEQPRRPRQSPPSSSKPKEKSTSAGPGPATLGPAAPLPARPDRGRDHRRGGRPRPPGPGRRRWPCRTARASGGHPGVGA